MKRVIGIGGIFFKSKNPKKLIAWYRKHLGMEPTREGGVAFNWNEATGPRRQRQTIWSPFPKDTDYFAPGKEPYMINYIVEDLEALLAQLRKERVQILNGPDVSEYGRFAWILDPDGRRVELWEPPVSPPTRNKAGSRNPDGH